MRKKAGEFDNCLAILEKSISLLHEQAGYQQTTVVSKLRSLDCTVSTSWLSVALHNRRAGYTTLKKVVKALETIILQELGMRYDTGLSAFADAKSASWTPKIVPESPLAESQITFYPAGRLSVQEKVAFISTAREEVVEVGVRLNSFSNYFITQNENVYQAHILELLRRGVHIRGYLIDPDSNEASLYFKDRGSVQSAEKGATDEIKKIIERLKNIAAELAPEPWPGKFEIFKYKHLPYGFFLVVDGHSDTGKMLISPYLFGIRRANCPVMAISKKDQPSLFRKYWESVQYMIQDAQILI